MVPEQEATGWQQNQPCEVGIKDGTPLRVILII